MSSLTFRSPVVLGRLLVLACFPAVGFFLPTTGCAQSPAEASQSQAAESATESGAEIDETIAALDQFIEATRQQWGVPGLAVAIVKDDQVVLAKGYGVRELGGSETVDEHTLFAIASNSKAFTSASLAMLVEQQSVAWDDPVRKHLPWLQLKDPVASQELTVRDLLCHRSGLGTFSGDLVWWGTGYSPREVLTRIRHLPPASSFRSQYGYSNLMYLAAGEVIRESSGMPWSEFVSKKILQPLGMSRTITSVRDLVSQGNYATPHKVESGGAVPIAWMNWDNVAPVGGIISSVSDMSRWIRVQLKRGQIDEADRLFSEEQSREMWKAHTPIPVTESYQELYPSTNFRSYGLGWSMSDYHGRKLVGHGGGYDGMYSQVMMVPEERFGVVVLTNSMTSISPVITFEVIDRLLGVDPPEDRSEQARERFLKSRTEFRKKIEKAMQPLVEGTQPSHPLEDYTGTYQSPLYGDVVVSQEDDALVLRMVPTAGLVADLSHRHYDTFTVRWRDQHAWFAGGNVNFVANADGQFVEIELEIPNDDLWFYELELQLVEKNAQTAASAAP